MGGDRHKVRSEMLLRARHHRLNLSVRVWRCVGDTSRGLFTFAGAVDAASLRAVMRHVERLTDAVPGNWRVDVVAGGLDGPALSEVLATLHDLRNSGQRARLMCTSWGRRLDLRSQPMRAIHAPAATALLH